MSVEAGKGSAVLKLGFNKTTSPLLTKRPNPPSRFTASKIDAFKFFLALTFDTFTILKFNFFNSTVNCRTMTRNREAKYYIIQQKEVFYPQPPIQFSLQFLHLLLKHILHFYLDALRDKNIHFHRVESFLL